MILRRLIVLLILVSSVTAQESEREEKRQRFAYLKPKIEAVVPIDGDGAAGRARKVYEAWSRGKAEDAVMPRETMAEIYRAAGGDAAAFKTVAYLIKSGTISDGHSVAMARVREAAIVELIRGIATERGWKVARSDSGNVTSGMKSDLDQTFYVFEPALDDAGNPLLRDDGSPEMVRNPELDGAFIAEFERRWDAELAPLGLSREALDVASIEGRNRFPDPRQSLQGGFWSENRRATEALRNTPGAYTYAGAVAHQMQFRAMQAIVEENERAYQIFAPDADGNVEYRGTDADEAVATMFGKTPELRPTFAFDAAIANFLELQHYMHKEKFETKYHLRTWEDSLHALMLAEDGKGREAKVDLTKVSAQKRSSLVAASLQRLFPDDPVKLQRHALAMEISTKQRLVHKGEIAISDAELFADFGKAVLGNEWDGSAGALADVRREYRRTASEFCLEASYHASGEALALLVGDDPKNRLQIENYRELLGFKDVPDAEWNATVERLRDATQLTFLFGIYDLGFERSKELMSRLARDHGLRAAPYLFGLWLRGSVQGLESHVREPGRYAALYADAMTSAGEAMASRTREYVLGELGFRHEDVINRATGELASRQLIWDGRTVARNMALDPGNIDAFAQIIKTFILSEGDWDATMATIADEFILALPVVGQIVGASRGGVGGLIVMGAAMAYPPIGAVLIAVSLAEAGYAIYEAEYARPVADQVENAIYRGYIGPELRYYDRPPPEFTKADRKELDDLRARLGTAKPPESFTPPYTYDIEVLRAARKEHERRLADWSALQKELGPKIAALDAKRAASERYRRDPAAGGGFFGFGAQLQQRDFGPSLFSAIEPIISFSPAGFVDFRAREDADELAALEAAQGQQDSLEDRLAFEAELRRARLLRSRRLRADRYREQALGRTAVDERERRDEPQTSVELRHKIRRDSLFPALLELGIDDPDVYFDRWFETHPDVMDRLVTAGVLENDSGTRYVVTPTGPVPQFTRRSPLSAESKESLRARFRADWLRSKALWETFERIEENRLLKEKQDLAQRGAALEGVAASLAVEEVYGDPALGRLYDALRGRAEPEPGTPAFDATVYRSEKGVECGFTLRCDALRYPPPYRLDLRTLGLKDAWEAAERGRIDDVPLAPSACSLFKEMLKKKPGANEPDASLIVVTCFDALGDPVGQSLAFDLYEGEPDVGYVISSRADSDAAGIDRILKKRFPEFAGRFDARLTGSPLKARRSDCLPRVVEIDFKEVASLIAYADGADPLDVSDAVGRYRGGGYRGSITCNGHTEHFISVREPRGGLWSPAQPQVYGLKNGDNDVKVDITLVDGTRLSRSYTIAAKVKPFDDSRVSKARAYIDESEAVFREKGTYYDLKRHYDALGNYCLVLVGSGGMPSGKASFVGRMVSLLPELRRLHGEPKRTGLGAPMSRKAGLLLCKHIAFRCDTWGTKDAYSALSRAFDGMRSLEETKGSSAGDHAYIEGMLGRLLIRSGGDAAAARKHLEREAILRRGRRTEAEIRADFDAKWPTGAFWN